MPNFETHQPPAVSGRERPAFVNAIRSRLRRAETPPEKPSALLPPGGRDDLDALEKADRAALIRRAGDLGPIFTGVSHGELCVVVMGLQRGRQILLEHADSLRPWAIDATALVPKGVLRQMQGADHLDYRRPLVRAAKGRDPAEETAILGRVTRHHLDEFVQCGETTPRALLQMTSAIATSALVTLFFGVEPGSDGARRLVSGYHELGPHGLAWNIGPRQHEAFGVLRSLLRSALAARQRGNTTMHDRCVLAQVADETSGDVDETMLGNLIYAVEGGRTDVANQLRWITRYAAGNPALLDAVAAETAGGTVGERFLAEAFALEELRSDQAERLTRIAQRDFAFDGYLIPAGAHVRICLWEAHQDPLTFVNPERFDPTRFTGALPSNDQFAPFGVDHHQCPFGATTVRIGSVFVELLATEFRPTLLSDGPPVRGAYHWEASRRLAVSISRRTATPTNPRNDRA